MTILAPSILAGDHSNLASSAKLVADLNIPWIHLDIMDGHFVPNLSFGPQTVAALRPLVPNLFFDTHLMLSEPHLYIEPFAKAGANLISIHIEPEYDHAAALKKIRSLNCQNGIVINPGTPVSSIEHLLPDVDLVLVMTVQPGFGGQSFRHDCLPKISQLHQLRQQHNYRYRLEVDGGVDLATAPLCKSAGADTLVAGTAFFKAPDKPAFIKTLTS